MELIAAFHVTAQDLTPGWAVNGSIILSLKNGIAVIDEEERLLCSLVKDAKKGRVLFHKPVWESGDELIADGNVWVIEEVKGEYFTIKSENRFNSFTVHLSDLLTKFRTGEITLHEGTTPWYDFSLTSQ